MTTKPTLRVELVYADHQLAIVQNFEMPVGSTVADVIERAKQDPRWHGIPIEADRLANFGQAVMPKTVLADESRIEIVRPLAIDPKEARRARAKQHKK